MISLQESHLIHSPSAMMTLLPLDSSLRLNQATVTLHPRLGGGRRQRLAQRRLELSDELADVVDETRRARARLDEADDGRADHRAVGEAPDRRHLRGRADTET